MKKCVHHYVLEEHNGPKSNGVCKKCGDEKVHTNSIMYTTKLRETSSGHMQEVVDFSIERISNFYNR